MWQNLVKTAKNGPWQTVFTTVIAIKATNGHNDTNYVLEGPFLTWGDLQIVFAEFWKIDYHSHLTYATFNSDSPY